MATKGALQENHPFGCIFGVCLGSEYMELEIPFKVPMQMQTKSNELKKKDVLII